jgi:hypothetical protein
MRSIKERSTSAAEEQVYLTSRSSGIVSNFLKRRPDGDRTPRQVFKLVRKAFAARLWQRLSYGLCRLAKA